MARWRLRNPHYLNILDPDTGESTKWEYSETDRVSGKARRKLYNVPQLLDPKDPTLQNFGEDIIVCHEGKGEPKDIVFFGEPTPDMEPFDEEAEEISKGLQAKWTHPIETLPTNGGMNEAEQAFMKNMMETFAKQVGASMTPVPAVSSNDDARFKALEETIKRLEAQIAAQNVPKPAPAPTIERRV